MRSDVTDSDDLDLWSYAKALIAEAKRDQLMQARSPLLQLVPACDDCGDTGRLPDGAPCPCDWPHTAPLPYDALPYRDPPSARPRAPPRWQRPTDPLLPLSGVLEPQDVPEDLSMHSKESLLASERPE